MNKPIGFLYNGDAYIVQVASDFSPTSIERFDNNKNVVGKSVAITELDLDPRLRTAFDSQIPKQKP